MEIGRSPFPPPTVRGIIKSMQAKQMGDPTLRFLFNDENIMRELARIDDMKEEEYLNSAEDIEAMIRQEQEAQQAAMQAQAQAEQQAQQAELEADMALQDNKNQHEAQQKQLDRDQKTDLALLDAENKDRDRASRNTQAR